MGQNKYFVLKMGKSQDAFVLMEMVQSGEHKGEAAIGGEHCWREALREEGIGTQ